MNKRKFTHAERYAVWHCHDRRCWQCNEPLRLEDTTIDHFIPESLLENDEGRLTIFDDYGLTESFNINGFENWLPCHGVCNQKKGSKVPRFVPGLQLVLYQLMKNAPEVKRTALKISANTNFDRIFGSILSALEGGKIGLDDLRELFGRVFEEPAPLVYPEEIIVLNNGYWMFRKDIAREGVCTCERKVCVESKEKVYCYFRPDLPSWVIKSGLFSKCYDEIIQCNRCPTQHKRGHIGKDGVCLKPYLNQELQID